MTVLHSQAGQTIHVLGDTVQIKLKSQDSASSMAVVVVEVPPSGQVPPHTHAQEEESYYMLEGSITLHLGSEAFAIAPGDFVHIPAGTVHGYINPSNQAARFLAWTIGGAIDQFFIEMSEQIRAIPEDLPKMPEILAKYGVQPVELACP